jgi:quinoprotein relay system zinc metallohydrolase 1
MPTMTRPALAARLAASLAARLALAMLLLAGLAPVGARAGADAARFDYQLAARALAPGVWVVEGENADFSPANGCNIINTGFIATGAGVLVINTGPSKRYGEQLRALIRRTTAEPVIGVLHLNLHPDYFLGNQAFADVPRYASHNTREGMAREAKAYEDNLYRLCGDWMLGTEALLPDQGLPVTLAGAPGSAITPVTGTRWRVGEREFMLHEASGHTASDLVLIDRRSGIAFVGGLVFVDRIPTTPHARIEPWLASLDRLQTLVQDDGMQLLVPSHGPVRAGTSGIAQTRAYLGWLDTSFSSHARAGWEMSEVLRAPPPEPFASWAAVKTEYVRNVAHMYPGYERRALTPTAPR